MSEIASAFVRIRPEMTGFKQQTESATKSAFSGVGRIIAAAGIGVAIGKAFKTGFDELQQGQLVAAQTAAAIKSTGGAANVTAGEIQRLGEAMLKKTGIDDEAIEVSENMLLTFGKIRNEAGKGNDVFNQTTKAVLDMDTAMTHGNVTAESLRGTSILVGKALQDPIKGATALRRVGVDLDDQQKKLIATFIKNGDTMGAQKVILAELNKEFGGSAAAMGQTLPGKINILKESFKNLMADALTRLLPTFTKIVDFATKYMPTAFKVMGQIFSTVFETIGPPIRATFENIIIPAIEHLISISKTIVGAIKPHWDSVKDVFYDVAQEAKSAFDTIKEFGDEIIGGINFLRRHRDAVTALTSALAGLTAMVAVHMALEKANAAAIVVATIAVQLYEAWVLRAEYAQLAWNAILAANPIGIVVVLIAGLVAALVVLYLRSQTARDIINKVWADIKAVVSSVVAFLKAIWDVWGSSIIAVARLALNTVKQIITNDLNAIKAIFTLFGDLIHGRWGKLWDDFKNVLRTTMIAALGIFSALGQQFGAQALAIGRAILTGILDGIAALPGLLAAGLRRMAGVIAGVAAEAGAWAGRVGAAIIQGILNGVDSLWGSLTSKFEAVAAKVKSIITLGGLIGSPSPWFTEVGKAVISGFLLGLNDLPKVSDKIQTAMDKIKTIVQSQQTVVTDAFSRLGQAGISAFEAKTNQQLTKMSVAFAAKIKNTITDPLARAMSALDAQAAAPTATEQKIKDLNDARDEAGRQQAITDARGGLAAAQGAGDAAGVVAAQKQLDDALFTEQIFQLQKTADAERAARDKQIADQRVAVQADYDARQAAAQKVYDTQVLNYQSQRDLQETHLNAILAKLQERLAQHPEEWKKIHAKIMAMFKTDFGPDFALAGKNLGIGFAKGIRDSFSAVREAVKDLAQIISNHLPHSPAKEGPLRTMPDWQAFLLTGLKPGMVGAALAAAIGVGAGGSLAAGAGGGTGPQIAGALAPLGTLVQKQDAMLAELQKQTAIAEAGKVLKVTLPNSSTGEDPNLVALEAKR